MIHCYRRHSLSVVLYFYQYSIRMLILPIKHRDTWDYLLLRKQIINLFLERFCEICIIIYYCKDNRSVLIWPINACDVTASMNRTVSRSKDCFSLLQRIYFCLRLLSSDYVDFGFTRNFMGANVHRTENCSIAINN